MSLVKNRRFGDLCKFIRGPFGGSLKKNCFKPDGIAVYEQQHAIYNQFSDIRYFIDEKKFQEMKRFELFPGDLIMSCSGTMGKVAIVPKEIKKGIINQALLKLTPSENLDVRYLKYWMESETFLDNINKKAVGAAIKNVASVKILKEIELPYFRKEEQQQIVQILDQIFEKIDQAIANIEQNIKNAEELFRSELNQIFTRNSGDWEKKRVKEIFKTGAGGTPLKSKRAYYEDGNIPWLLSGEIKQGEIHQATNFITKKGLENSSAKLFPENSVLVAMYGATAGDVGILKFKASTNQAVCAILPNKDFLPEFIYYNFLFKRKELVSKATGNAQPNISQIKIKETTIPVIPLARQKILVEKLKELGERKTTIIKTYQRKLEILLELKGAILEKAFKGELTKEEVTV